MTNSQKQTVKNLGWVLLGIILILIAAFFISTCSYITASESYDQSYFENAVYQTRDKTTTLFFNENATKVTLTTEDSVYDFEIAFEDNILFFENTDVKYELIVINERTLFANTGQYFYLIRSA